jgi:hypothetical protein
MARAQTGAHLPLARRLRPETLLLPVPPHVPEDVRPFPSPDAVGRGHRPLRQTSGRAAPVLDIPTPCRRGIDSMRPFAAVVAADGPFPAAQYSHTGFMALAASG